MPTREERARKLGVPVDQLPDGRGRHGNHARGTAHPRWNDGRIISDHGYVKIRVGCGHPLADPNGYAYEHDMVMITALGRPLGPDEIVHHKREKTDNRIENLELLTRSEHAKLHDAERERSSTGQFVGGRTPKAGGRLLDGRTWDEFPRQQIGAAA